MTQEKLIDRLRKLYAHAESASAIGNEAEAQAFMGKVHDLMREHKLEASILADAGEVDDEPIDTHSFTPTGKRKSQQEGWVWRLAQAICPAFFCELMIIPGTNKIVLVGKKSDREVCEYVIVSVATFLESEAKKQHGALRYRLWKEMGDMSQAHGFVLTFKLAAINRIRERLAQVVKSEVAADTRFALVVQSSREALQKWMEDNVKGPGSKSTLRNPRNDFGAAAGRAAGDRANLTGNAVRGGSGASRSGLGKGPAGLIGGGK